MMAVLWRRTVVMLIPTRWAMASSCSPSAINSSTARCAGVRRSPGSAARDALSGVARSHSSSKYSGRVFGEVAELVAAIAPLGATAASGFLDQAGELLAARGPGTGKTDAG